MLTDQFSFLIKSLRGEFKGKNKDGKSLEMKSFYLWWKKKNTEKDETQWIER